MKSLKYSRLYPITIFTQLWRDGELGTSSLLIIGFLWFFSSMISFIIAAYSGSINHFIFFALTQLLTILLLRFCARSSAQMDGYAYARGPSSERGRVAEKHFAQMLGSLLPNDTFLLENIRLPYARSKTGERELDVILVSPKGIWIVEIKNYRGRLGVSSKEYWTLSLDDEAEMRRNAFRQLWSQKKALTDWLLSSHIAPPHCINGGIVALIHPDLIVDQLGTSEFEIAHSASTIVKSILNSKDLPLPMDAQTIAKKLSRQREPRFSIDRLIKLFWS